MAGVETYQLGEWKLQSGQSIPDVWIAYSVFGDPKSPAIIYPTWYSVGEQYTPTPQVISHKLQQFPIMFGSLERIRF